MTATSPTGTGVEPVASGVQQPGFMQPEAMLAYLSDRLEARLTDSVIAHGQLTVVVDPEAWVDAVRLCKEDAALDCRYWEFLDAIDRGDDGFDCYVHIYSITHRHAITLQARVPGGREKPVMPSLTGVFRGADWSERETYDMFGIEFEGHPGLRPRILTIENFEGWPLRKDFQLTSRNAKPWPGAKEPGEPGESHAAGEAEAVAAGAPAGAPEDKAAAAKAKAERAKAKAAAMRAQKAAERAAAEGGTPASADSTAATGTQGSGDAVADAAETFGGGDTEGEAAAAAATAAGDETAATPEGAADVADSAIAKDAAAGIPQGDVAEGSPQDVANVDEPVVDDAAEAAAAEGAPPSDSGTPGVEAEGRHGGAEDQTVTEQRDADVVPAPGSEAAPLESDVSSDVEGDAGDAQVGLDRDAEREADTVQDGPAQSSTEAGPSPYPSPSEQTDAADRADDDRALGSDAAEGDEQRD